MRIFTGKCAVSQNGSGTGYWQVAITNFNDPAGQFDTTEITVGDFLLFTDSGEFYQLEVTEVVSASGSSATIKVSNVGVTGITSVPTTNNAAISRGSTNYELIPWIANISGNENQLFTEDLMVKIDTALDSIAGGGGGPTNLTFTGASTPYSLNSSTGAGVTFAAGSGVTLSRVSDELTISASGGGGATDLTWSGSATPFTLNSSTGTDVNLASGANISLSRVGQTLTVAATGVVTGVTDQVNGLDITNTSNNITIAPNIPELTTLSSFDTLDSVMIYDNDAATHKKAAMGTYFSTGFVDLTTDQTISSGTKKFGGKLQYGTSTLPTGSSFGAADSTVFALKGGTGSITESDFADFGGLIIKTVYDGSTGDNVTNIVATGKDTGNDSGAFKFYTRNNQVSANWVQGLYIYNTASSTLSLFGNADTSSGAAVCVPTTGIGVSTAGNGAYKFQTVASSNHTFQLIQDAGFEVAYCDQSVTGWKDPSDERLKYDIQTLKVLENIDNLRGVSFKLKDGDRPHIGVIAQEIEKAYPEIVSEGPNGMKGVSYSAVGAVALQGVKELYEENKILTQTIQSLLKRIELLENK